MKVIPFLYLENALEAIDFYIEVFDAKVQGEMTMIDNIPSTERFKSKIGHCSLLLDDTVLFIADSIDEYGLTKGDDMQLVFDLGTEDRLLEVFSLLKENGEVIEELHEVFRGALFGSVKDQFGVTWQIYSEHK